MLISVRCRDACGCVCLRMCVEIIYVLLCFLSDVSLAVE